MIIIVNCWPDGLFPNIVVDKDGEVMKFSTKEEAQEYANKELNGYNKVVELGV